MWGTKTETIPVIVGAALGAMPHSMKGNSKKILKNLKEERNRTGHRTTSDGPHSSKAAAPPIFEHSKEPGRDLE